jgi:UDP-N-acetylmuramoyl-tripeptide--D-alanyl-D-alanine ligase
MRIEALYLLYQKSYKVVKDTREEVRDSMYFALKGAHFNGNKYALQALEKGANYAVIDEEAYQVDDRMILVDDAMKCLQDLARYHRQQLAIPILALTGSNGKTTTKELINVVLQKKYKCFATRGNLNNHLGVPLTLLSIRPEHEFGVVEMGANHVHEIEELCNIALPDYGYITNFGRVHLEGFGSFEGVIKGKTEMYAHIRDRDKWAFVNSADKIQVKRSQGMNCITFGPEGADYKIDFLDADPFVRIDFRGTLIKSKLIGAYNYSNIAMAVAVGAYFEVPVEDIRSAVESYVPANNRSQIIEKDSNRIILDAYNANPNSMEAALNNLNGLSAKHKIAILGDMFELGKDTTEEHQKIAVMLEKSNITQAFLIGETFSEIHVTDKRIGQFSSFDEFKNHMMNRSFSDTTFLIKASRGMALERTLELL